MSKRLVSWSQAENHVLEIIRQISSSRWQPEYVVGITRGGLIPATLISHWLECKMYTLDVSLRDGDGGESNLWMAEDAFGYQAPAKNILIVDDINDSGSTMNWIVEDWQKSCLPGDDRWDHVWNGNVRFATLYDKLSSKFTHKVDYAAEEISSDRDNEWIYFPWETWWSKDK